MAVKVLVIDDEPAMCELAEVSLTRQGYEVKSVNRAEDALELVAREDFDVVVTDLHLTGMDGIALCERMLGIQPDVPVVVLTGHGSMETAIRAIRVGAYDFLSKPLNVKQLGLTVERAAQHRALRVEVRRLREAVNGVPVSELLGTSPAMRKIQALIAQVAPTEASALVTGETGTGKELIARAIHDLSNKRSGPFIAINCAAVPPNLIESELFGHVKGAFTDAARARTGLFVQASGGTLFLDEIGEMPLEMQPKLLRALQERRVRPVGGNTEVPFDARIVASTNRDLETEVHEKRFREDLYYRINVVTVVTPPLRERGGDILVLAQHFLTRAAVRNNKEMKGISPTGAQKLMSYSWPGNVRELENCMERAVALTRFDHVTIDDLPDKIRAYQTDRLEFATDDASDLVTLDTLEQRYITRVLAVVSGNKSLAAKVLGLNRRTLYRKLDRIELLQGRA